MESPPHFLTPCGPVPSCIPEVRESDFLGWWRGVGGPQETLTACIPDCWGCGDRRGSGGRQSLSEAGPPDSIPFSPAACNKNCHELIIFWVNSLLTTTLLRRLYSHLAEKFEEERSPMTYQRWRSCLSQRLEWRQTCLQSAFQPILSNQFRTREVPVSESREAEVERPLIQERAQSRGSFLPVLRC